MSPRPVTAPIVVREMSRPRISPAVQGPPPRAVSAQSTEPRKPRQPAQAITVVEADETIADVALRVYGTTSHADALWRANRDALPRRDSPLVPGTLLRTPTIR
jgi:hypothetical protein